MAGAVLHETVIQEADLHEVFADCPRLDIIVVRLGNTAKEVHGVGIAQIIVQGRQNEAFRAKDLRDCEPVIGDMAKVGDVGRQDLLVLGSNEHGSDADQL